ncbi:MAG: hypothetical protein ACK4E0_17985 [Chitinophagaceae bacterium]
MTTKILHLVVCIFNLTNAFSQEQLWLKQTKVSEAIAFEKEINANPQFLSQNVSLSKSFYPLADKYPVANPIIVQREPLGYLPLYVEYFYTPQDSIIRLISFDWEKDLYGNFFDKQKIWKEEAKKFGAYNKEYERIKSMLVVQLGAPSETDSDAKEVSSENGNYFTRNTIWETEDLYANLNMIFASMTYRVRLTVYWKK